MVPRAILFSVQHCFGSIEENAGEIYAAFSPKLLQIPFGVKLEDFIVDRNEGSESVAMWTSKIRIDDSATRESQKRKVWMNHPTWYKGWKIAKLILVRDSVRGCF